jgi:hypothetical protein
VPPTVKGQILQRLIDYLDREHEEGATCSDRQALAAARTLVEFMRLTLDQAKLDLARERMEAERPPPEDAERKPRIIIPGSGYTGRSEDRPSDGSGEPAP